MRTSDFYAFCLAGFVLGLVWLILGGPGVLCAVAAMIVGNLDISWIDDLEAAHARRDETPAASVPDAGVPVVPVAWRAVPVPLPEGVTPHLPPSPLKPRWMRRKLPANVVVLKPRKVS